MYGEGTTYLGENGHNNPEWRLRCSDKWRNPKSIIPIRGGKQSTKKDNEPESEILKDMRKKQFFLFFSDFFTKFDKYNRDLKKQGLSVDKEYFKFDDKQRAAFMRNYFKKYFKKDARKLPSRIEKI